MATIKPIEGSSVHRIQSGQVIVDLCSVVKELVENGLDAGATAIDVRFKNYGLDAIEVQDNGSGISKEDYQSIALKHYTSKLSNYDDLENLDTFGFRGEALSSLCAVSNIHITTAREEEAPQGTRLDLETSGKLKGTSVVACQRGTTVFVENIFNTLVVRRKELEKNIKREYTKVLNLLQAYACISVDVRISVSNTIGKQRKEAFKTKGNKNTRDNIANVYGAKMLSALIPLDLQFEMQSSSTIARGNNGDRLVKVVGHVSRPVLGEGRQTPDRQMFFVNSRPCTLPQVAKVINEVYKSYNLTQSPFIFANVLLNTNAYDVNVSPDKRTILLHDQGPMLASVRTTLTELFEQQQQTVPQSQNAEKKLPSYKPLTISRQTSLTEDDRSPSVQDRTNSRSPAAGDGAFETPKSISLISQFAGRNAQVRLPEKDSERGLSEKQKLIQKLAREGEKENEIDEYDDARDAIESDAILTGAAAHVRDFNQRMAEIQARAREGKETISEDPEVEAQVVSKPLESPEGARELQSGEHLTVEFVKESTNTGREVQTTEPKEEPEEEIPSVSTTPVRPTPGVVPNAFDRMRPLRMPAETATITIGSKTLTATIGSQPQKRAMSGRPTKRSKLIKPSATQQFSNSLRSFAAPGTQLSNDEIEDEGMSNGESEDDQQQMSKPGSISEIGENEESEEEEAEMSGSQDVDRDEAAELKEVEAASDDDAQSAVEDSSDDEYIDEATKKAREEARVEKLIRKAEAKAAIPTQENVRRAQNLLKGAGRHSTTRLVQAINTSVSNIERQLNTLNTRISSFDSSFSASQTAAEDDTDAESAEERLSLIVSKSDFRRMRVVGQFNLGFIIALRPSNPTLNSTSQSTANAIPPPSSDDLFIIDQHASDEKYNFERLSRTTLQNQRLVHPQTLDLTALEEEILTNAPDALQANGFGISVDDSGAAPVGRRCTLTSLPTSREVTFDTRDLEELIALLGENPSTTTATTNAANIASGLGLGSLSGAAIPRPSKVRRLLAMRACRSSVMIGRTLTDKQMARLVAHMGEIDKPWNCPHGRPTMRHLLGLGGWRGWGEGVGRSEEGAMRTVDWGGWLGVAGGGEDGDGDGEGEGGYDG